MNIKLPYKFPEGLRALREERGLSQEELRNRCGFKSRSTIFQYETGERYPRANELKKLAKHLATSVMYLQFGIDAESPRLHRLPVISWNDLSMSKRPPKKVTKFTNIFWPVEIETSDGTFITREGTDSFLVVDPARKPVAGNIIIFTDHGRNHYGTCATQKKRLVIESAGSPDVPLANVDVIGVVVYQIKKTV